METRTVRYDEMIILNPNDAILETWQLGCNGINATLEQLQNYPHNVPIAFRGMTKKHLVDICKQQQRDFYYIDTGYLGNLRKRKDYHRVVKNNVQHTTPIDVPGDRFEQVVRTARVPIYSQKWKDGSNILVVTPSEKPCKFYGITRNTWLNTTIAELQKNTDRNIIVRDKPMRRDRVGDGSIYNQFINDDIYAVVTYNSIAATEAVAFGIPAFTNITNAAQSVTHNDFSLIEKPYRPDREKVRKWLNWLCYCQYTCKELSDGTAYMIQQEYNLC